MGRRGGEAAEVEDTTVAPLRSDRPVDGVVAARWLDRLAQLVAAPLQVLL